MSVPDRDLVREALTYLGWPDKPIHTMERRVVEAAAAWSKQGNAIIIQRDDNGKWPEAVMDWIYDGIYLHEYTMSELLDGLFDALSVEDSP